MIIRELQIINFRNLRFLRGEFAPGMNLIYGSNAQGKTNVIEAVHLLVTGRSFRTTMDREMIPWDRDGYEATLIRARIEKRIGEERFLLSFNQSEKHIFVNGTPIARLGELIGRINAVLFTPSDLQLVRGAPGLRRRFLDIELSQVSASYLLNLQRYDLALKQRNALLKQHQKRPTLRDELGIYDTHLASNGCELTWFRAAAINKLSGLAAKHYARISGSKERLELIYEPSPSLPPAECTTKSLAQLEAAFRNSLADDIRRGATSVGPHRDDFSFHLDGHDARDYGSQGQQRSCVLAMKLAELQFMQEATGEMPLLLLDDLMSELDQSRQQALLESLDTRAQTFITTTEKQLVTSLIGPAKVFEMEDGELRIEE